MGRQRSAQLVEGDVELDEIGKVQIRNCAGEVVAFEVKRPEAGQLVEIRRDLTGEVVSGEIQADEILQGVDGRRDLAGELVALEVEVAEVGAEGDVRRELAGEGVEAEAEGAEGGEVSENAGRNRADEAGAGEADDGDAEGLALHAQPGGGARALRRIPRQRSSHCRSERQERLPIRIEIRFPYHD